MASIAMVVSELAHSIKQPNNKALRENLKVLIIHTRNEVIRRSFENHGYIDSVLTQRYKVSLTDVNDGDIILPDYLSEGDIDKIKRSTQKIPKPVRLPNNMPFDRVSSVGAYTNKVIPFIKETSTRFKSAVPGLCSMSSYDYINGYIYIIPPADKIFKSDYIVIQSAFEHPTEIQLANNEIDTMDIMDDENEWLISEDMLGQIKDIIYKRDMLNQIRETNEIPKTIEF